ncbi:hypothetical protein CEXT_729571 [Caerostris extrusa]|uniref:Uncharacterized protein n=1 Tax=Caerostris extrusa TaxID=172846 RepID=A0AAV4WSA2_CAEEX|nr:hypothetical protein CEXT_729571 [Caerostris extrusa]
MIIERWNEDRACLVVCRSAGLYEPRCREAHCVGRIISLYKGLVAAELLPFQTPEKHALTEDRMMPKHKGHRFICGRHVLDFEICIKNMSNEKNNNNKRNHNKAMSAVFDVFMLHISSLAKTQSGFMPEKISASIEGGHFFLGIGSNFCRKRQKIVVRVGKSSLLK